MIELRHLVNASSSCLGCGAFIERLHPDYVGVILHPTERRVIIGCFDCAEALKRKAARLLES